MIGSSERITIRLLRWAVWRWPFARGRGVPWRAAKGLAGNQAITFGIGDGCTLTGALTDYVVDWAFQGFHRRDGGFMRSLSLLGPGDIAVDVGANVGVWTRLAAAHVGTAGRVLAVEPMPGTAAQLQLNVHQNGFAQILVRQCALSDRDGHVAMFGDSVSTGQAWQRVGRQNSGAAGLSPVENGESVEIDVISRQLDSVLEEEGLDAVSVLKIDVEGAELLVLRGAACLLASRKPPVIFLEVSPRLTQRFGWRPVDVLSFLSECGYGLFRVRQDRLISVRPDAWCGHGDALCVPRHRLAEIDP